VKHIWLLIFLSIAGQSLFSQTYADKTHYLIEELALSKLSADDIHIIDSCLTIFHNATEDTTKIIALAQICDNIADASWSKYQIYLFEFIKDKIDKATNQADQNRLAPYFISALTNMGLIEIDSGHFPKAISYYEKSLEAATKINFDLGIARSYSGMAYVNHIQGDLTKALAGYKKGYTLYKSIGDKHGMADNLLNIGEINRRLGNHVEAQNSYEKCIQFYKKIAYKNGIAICYNNLALIKTNIGDIPQAINLYSKSLAIFIEIGSKSNSATAHINIGDLYLKLKEKENALSHYNKALAYFQELGIKKMEALSLSNIARVYNYSGQYDLALSYFNKSLEIEKSIQHNAGFARCYSNIAKLYYDQKQLAKAIDFSAKSLAIYEKLDAKEDLAISSIGLANFLLENGELQKAKKHGKKGFEVAMQLGYPFIIKDAAKLMSEIAKRKGDYKTALAMSDLYIQMRDSIINLKNKTILIRKRIENEHIEKTARLREKDALNKVKLKNQRAKIKEQGYLGLLATLVAIILFLLVLWRRSKYNLKIKWLQEDIFKSQMRPHFLFNVLVSIQSLIVQKRDKDAIHYLSEIATFMRSNLNIISLKKITLKQELELAEQYLNLEKLRFKEKLNFEIINNTTTTARLLQVPSLLTQPLIENAIIHGFKGIDYAGEISVRAELANDSLCITIKDNGIGFNFENKKDSKGISIVKSRLKLASMKNRLEISQNAANSGTKVEVYIFN